MEGFMRRRELLHGFGFLALNLILPLSVYAELPPEILSCTGHLVRPDGAGVTLTAANGPVVHEWGTFTCLQNEAGEAIGGINADDEPVPEFVHRIAHFLVLGPGAN